MAAMASVRDFTLTIFLLSVANVFVSSVSIQPRVGSLKHSEVTYNILENGVDIIEGDEPDIISGVAINEEEISSSLMQEITNNRVYATTRLLSFQNLECTTGFPSTFLQASSLIRISSPNFPGRYLQNNDCGWRFSVPSGYRLSARCYIAGVRSENYVKFFDVQNNNATWYTNWYRTDIHYNFWGSSAHISFTTNNDRTHRGFFCFLYLVPRSGATPSPTTTTLNPNPAVTTTTSTTTTTTAAPPSNQCRCGRKRALRIVGGVEASNNEFPWMVSLKLGGNNFCGGVLISCDTVLTAAHCVDGLASLTVDIGLHSQSDSSSSYVSKPSRLIIRHPNYNSSTEDYDVALIKIDCIPFTDEAIPVCLPTSSSTSYVGQSATVAGWGALTEGGSSPNTLHKVVVPVITNSVCNAFYNNRITSRMFCAGFDEGLKDSCQGDSGGPLMVTSNGVTEVAGIVSWGDGCARPNRPGVYASVPSLLSWIQQNSGLNAFNNCPR